MASQVYYVTLRDGKRAVCLDMEREPAAEVARSLVDRFGRGRLASIHARGSDACLLALVDGSAPAALPGVAAYDPPH